MNTESQAKDIAALLSRAGLRSGGAYHEFPDRVCHLSEVSFSSSTIASAAADIEEAQVVRYGEQARTSSKVTVPSLDRLLVGTSLHGAQGARAATKIAFFSLAGGVGKTTLATAVGRVLCGRMKRVVLANCDSSFRLQHLRALYSHTVGNLTFVHAPGHVSALPMTVFDAGETARAEEREMGLRTIQDSSLQADTVLLDLPANGNARTIESLKTADHIVVPLTADMHSAMTVRWVQELLSRVSLASRKVHYVLNRYDSSRSMHCEMCHELQEMLGSALLPNFIREEPQIQDAMRSGVTIIDHAPHTEVVAELQELAKWVETLLPCPELVKGMTA